MPTYSQAAINAQLQAIVNVIDGGGGNANLILLSGNTAISTLSLARPSGTVAAGVITFSGLPLTDPSAAASGAVTSGVIQDSGGNPVISNMTVGIPLSASADIVISNGLNTTFISSGQTVQVLSATITGV